ncbi:MAG: DNA sulfur modification protein DndB [Alphaproteobacteria bacterium]
MQIPETMDVKRLPNVAAMVEAAQQYIYGNRALFFEGTLFEQGGRVMFSTAMPFEDFVRVAEVKASAAKGDDVEAVAETTNRPIDKGHVRAITKYLTGAVQRHEKYIMPPATLNLRGGKGATLFTVVGESSIKTAILVLPSYARFDITDAQHRRAGLDMAMSDMSVRDQLLRDGIGVMITFEEDHDQVHQDFADASKTRPIADSLVAVYDNRLPVNALAVHLARNCRLFRYTIDATARGSNLSAGSVKVWNTSALRQFVKYAGLNNRAGDDAWNKAFVDSYGEAGTETHERFRNYLARFIDDCVASIPVLKKLASLNADDLSEVPGIRSQGGGQVLMTAAGMNVLGGVCYAVYRRHKLGEDITPYMNRLSTIDWSYEGALWKGELVNEEFGKTATGAMGKVLRVSANAAHVKGAIAKALQAIGLRAVDLAAA